jgi:hypothetical protein
MAPMLTLTHRAVRRHLDGATGRFWLVLLLGATSSAGCVQFGYDQVRLGQTQREYRAAFAEGQTRRTTQGLCYLEQDWLGQTDAVVLLLTADRRVAGKLHAVHSERRTLISVETDYELHGELDPALARLGGTGPVDTLRAVADELTTGDADASVREAHGWVAAGLVRLMQRWPHVGDEGPALTRLTAMLERVPGGGTAHISVDPNGVYRFEYTQGVAR